MRASSGTPVGGAADTRHKRLSDDYKHLSLTDGLRATRKKAGATIKTAELDPELAELERVRRRDAAGKILPARCCAGDARQPCAAWQKSRECEHSQTKAWCVLRDAFADKNRDLARRAAHTAWKRNTHLTAEIVPCCVEVSGRVDRRGRMLPEACAVACAGSKFGDCEHAQTSEWRRRRDRHAALHWRRCSRKACGGAVHCPWCHGKKERACQPDLEALAFSGLLEAIRLFDSKKAGRISSYAVWLIKQSMLTLLRQTPVSFPQDLLRDRRELAKFEKTLGREATQQEAAALLEKIRPSKKAENRRDRLALARNCYYGNERKSVEALQQKYVERADRFEKRARRGKIAGIAEALSSTGDALDEARARSVLSATIARLVPDEMDFATDAQYRAAKTRAEKHAASIEQFLSGNLPELPRDAVLALREAADVRMRAPLRVS